MYLHKFVNDIKVLQLFFACKMCFAIDFNAKISFIYAGLGLCVRKSCTLEVYPRFTWCNKKITSIYFYTKDYMYLRR